MSGADDSSPVGAPAGTPFAALLQRLRADGGDERSYESLRARLIRFFRLHAPIEAEDLADVALDRLARRLHDGTEIASITSYTLGIARMVAHEARARGARRHLAEEDPAFALANANEDSAAAERLLAALGACLDAAGENARRLILRYYGDDGAGRIALRRRLAAECGVSLNALRNRALRLRDALEDCVRERIGTDDA